MEDHPPLLFKQHFQREEKLEEITASLRGPLTKLHGAAKRNSACFPKKMSTADALAKGRRGGAMVKGEGRDRQDTLGQGEAPQLV